MTSLISHIIFNRKSGGPWGNRPTGGSNQGGSQRGSNQPPELDELLRSAQDRVRDMMGNSGGSGGMRSSGGGDSSFKPFIPLVVLAALAIWLYQSFYIVAQDEQGVVTRFGEYVQTTNPGPHFHLWPIEAVVKPRVTRENIVEVGFRSTVPTRFAGRMGAVQSLSNDNVIKVNEESLMLTGDENIVDLSFTVRWQIADPKDFLFNVYDPEGSLKRISESAMREVIGQFSINDAIANNKGDIQDRAKTLIQQIADAYRIGVVINGVELQQVRPPAPVLDAFRDVQAAKADAAKTKDQATGYANDIVPRARGKSAQILQEAEAYKAAKIAEATGAATRFNSQLVEYRKAPTVTKERLYIETMEKVLQNTNKVILSDKAGQGVLPYLPLNNKKEVK